MAFDQKIINQNSLFKWDNKNRELAAWNKDQTPRTWIENSTVWVSQRLAAQLGENKIKNYLMQFKYGNQDFSGDAGKHSGLTNAWLDSSLKISAEEQLTFLQALVGNTLPVSKEAIENTKANMYLETSPNGWKLYGKTGTGKSLAFAKNQALLPQGWFVGFVEKENQTYIFVLNFSDLKDPKTSDYAGSRAKDMAKMLLSKMNLF